MAVLVLLLHAVAVTSGPRMPAISGALVGGVFGLTFFGALTPWLLGFGPDAYLRIVGLSRRFTGVS